MAKVELIGKYDMSIGTVLIINSGSVLHIGDTIDVENNKYQIKKSFNQQAHTTKQRYQYLLNKRLDRIQTLQLAEKVIP